MSSHPAKLTLFSLINTRGRRGRDRMVVGFKQSVPITTSVVSSNPSQTMCTIQYYVIKFVSELRQVGGFLWVLRFSPPIKILLKVALCTKAFVSFKKYMPPPLPYFKVIICPLPLPHFASIFFAYL
jgi:hypothetical protein